MVVVGERGIEGRCWQQQGGIWFFWGCVCVGEVAVVAETKEQGGGQEGGRGGEWHREVGKGAKKSLR